jgi:hypothetical protein
MLVSRLAMRPVADRRGPKRSGSLYWTKTGWRARIRIQVDGESVRQSVDLETSSKAAARIKLKRLVAQNPAPAQLATEAKARDVCRGG